MVRAPWALEAFSIRTRKFLLGCLRLEMAPSDGRYRERSLRLRGVLRGLCTPLVGTSLLHSTALL